MFNTRTGFWLEMLVWALLPVVVAFWVPIDSPEMIYLLYLLPSVLLLVFIRQQRYGWTNLGLDRRQWQIGLHPWLSLTVVMVATIVLIHFFLPVAYFSGFVRNPALLWLYTMGYLILGGPVQELFYRGYLLRRQLDALPRRQAMLLNMALFGLLHLPFWVQRDAYQMVILSTVGGIFWTLTYVRYPNLYLAALSHSVVGVLALKLLQVSVL